MFGLRRAFPSASFSAGLGGLVSVVAARHRTNIEFRTLVALRMVQIDPVVVGRELVPRKRCRAKDVVSVYKDIVASLTLNEAKASVFVPRLRAPRCPAFDRLVVRLRSCIESRVFFIPIPELGLFKSF